MSNKPNSMRYAIKLGNEYYCDGSNPTSLEGFGPKEAATSWATKDAPDRIVRFWFNNNDNPKHINSWYCMRNGKNVGAFIREPETGVLNPNNGPLPEVVEVDFSKAPWNE